MLEWPKYRFPGTKRWNNISTRASITGWSCSGEKTNLTKQFNTVFPYIRSLLFGTEKGSYLLFLSVIFINYVKIYEVLPSIIIHQMTTQKRANNPLCMTYLTSFNELWSTRSPIFKILWGSPDFLSYFIFYHYSLLVYVLSYWNILKCVELNISARFSYISRFLLELF